MSKYKKTCFNESWLLDSKIEWVRPAKDDNYSAMCNLCNTKFTLSNMGKRALTSHAIGKKHQAATLNKTQSYSMTTFLKGNSSNSTITTDVQSVAVNVISPLLLSPSSESAKNEGVTEIVSTAVAVKEAGRLRNFLVNDDVTKSEIIWCLNSIMSHTSMRAAEKSVNLFKLMFPDSTIANKIQLGRAKIGYTILYGLAPYFHEDLVKMCLECPEIVIGFDESLNKVAQKGQMDIMVRFWNLKTNEVSTRYFTSTFLGHATAADLLKAFSDALLELKNVKLLQVSMDGPNVNQKFIRELKSTTDPDSPTMLDIGSCGLHSLHCAFKAAINSTNWGLVEFLRALYNLLKNVPARRADYVHYSGSELYPKKFCAVRWLQNIEVAERAETILPNVVAYVNESIAAKKAPNCRSFHIISTSVKDKLLAPKLAFFQSVAIMVEPFLIQFQSDAPLAPFLYEALISLMKSLMKRFVKSDKLDSARSLLELGIFNETNLLNAKYVDLGYATREAIRKTKGVSEKEILLFRQDCKTCLQKLCAKLLERSPLKYKLTKAISFLDPAVAVLKSTRSERLKSTLEIVLANNWITGVAADLVDRQFNSVCSQPDFLEKMNAFSKQHDRLDTLWMSIIPGNDDNQKLVSFLRLILILSHGNASLERGFSINRECIVENLNEASLIAQRQIYDSVKAIGGIEKVDITKSLIHSVRNARSRYKDSLEQKMKDKQNGEKQEGDRKRAAVLQKELQAKKQKILSEAQKQADILQEEIESLKKK